MNYNHDQLNWDMEIAGVKIINRGYLVCDRCVDEFQENNRAISLPADPLPVLNPKPENYTQDENNYRATQAGDIRGTSNGDLRVTNQSSS